MRCVEVDAELGAATQQPGWVTVAAQQIGEQRIVTVALGGDHAPLRGELERNHGRAATHGVAVQRSERGADLGHDDMAERLLPGVDRPEHEPVVNASLGVRTGHRRLVSDAIELAAQLNRIPTAELGAQERARLGGWGDGEDPGGLVQHGHGLAGPLGDDREDLLEPAAVDGQAGEPLIHGRGPAQQLDLARRRSQICARADGGERLGDR